jgi:hypothetical protein
MRKNGGVTLIWNNTKLGGSEERSNNGGSSTCSDKIISFI